MGFIMGDFSDSLKESIESRPRELERLSRLVPCRNPLKASRIGSEDECMGESGATSKENKLGLLVSIETGDSLLGGPSKICSSMSSS